MESLIEGSGRLNMGRGAGPERSRAKHGPGEPAKSNCPNRIPHRD
jgi:hypothetical protein